MPYLLDCKEFPVTVTGRFSTIYPKEIYQMTKISPLRQRFIDDMNLAGLAAGTQAHYISVILKFVRHCGNTPPQFLTEQQVEQYINERLATVARGTFQSEFAALKALFYRTLGREWNIFTKKKSHAQDAFDCPLPSLTKTANDSSKPSNIRSIAPA
jgi:hypothetical protein